MNLYDYVYFVYNFFKRQVKNKSVVKDVDQKSKPEVAPVRILKEGDTKARRNQ